MIAPLADDFIAALRRFQSNREDDATADNDALVKMSGDTWLVKHAGRSRIAATLADVPRVFEEMAGRAG